MSKPVSRTLLNGVVSTYEYDGLDRLTRLSDVNGTTSILDNQYAYNTASQIVEKTTPDTTQNFDYDALDRLSSVVSDGSPSESYTYDAVGNRTSSLGAAAPTYNPFNRLATTGRGSYGYDNNGNLIQGPFCQTCAGSPESQATYSYDFENRLTQVVEAWRGALFLWHYTTVNYKYDALGRRIQRATLPDGGGEGLLGGGLILLGVTTNFVYDGQDVIQDLDDSEQVVTSYLNGPGIDNKNSTDRREWKSLLHYGSSGQYESTDG